MIATGASPGQTKNEGQAAEIDRRTVVWEKWASVDYSTLSALLKISGWKLHCRSEMGYSDFLTWSLEIETPQLNQSEKDYSDQSNKCYCETTTTVLINEGPLK